MLTAEEPCHPIDQSRAVQLIKSVARDSFTCFVVDDVRVFLPLARFIYAGIVRARAQHAQVFDAAARPRAINAYSKTKKNYPTLPAVAQPPGQLLINLREIKECHLLFTTFHVICFSPRFYYLSPCIQCAHCTY